VYVDTDAVIGNSVKIQNFVSVYKGVTIEDEVFVGPSVTFTNDRYPRAFQWGEEDLVNTMVHTGASIGANATILCGITIGHYAMVGAGSVVTKDVADHGLVYGSPAKLQGYVCFCCRRLEEIISEDDENIRFRCHHCGKTVEIKKCVSVSLV
jgi:acetyltransferase-like isoleucine patch superfamily enzyme